MLGMGRLWEIIGEEILDQHFSQPKNRGTSKVASFLGPKNTPAKSRFIHFDPLEGPNAES